MGNNLFFVHTPMQLFVAQQLICQEKLQNNILWYGFVPGNEHFLEIYRLILIPEMWNEIIPRTVRVGWALVDFRRLFSSIRSVKSNFKAIDGFLRDKETTALYLGDIANRGHQLLAKIYHNKIKIVFFEEGSSHYMKTPITPPKNFKQRLIQFAQIALLDGLLFKPMWGFSYTKEFYFEYIDRDRIPMDERYSILPYYKQVYDKRLKVNKLFSSSLRKYIDKEIGPLVNEVDKQGLYLFLSSPIYDLTSKHEIPLFVETVHDYAKTISGCTVLVKFHPREKEYVKDMIVKQFTLNNVNFRIISNSINIPVEYYLQWVSFSKILAFASSSLLYNGYIYPLTPVIRLDHVFLQKCREHSIDKLYNIEKFCSDFDDLIASVGRIV